MDSLMTQDQRPTAQQCGFFHVLAFVEARRSACGRTIPATADAKSLGDALPEILAVYRRDTLGLWDVAKHTNGIDADTHIHEPVQTSTGVGKTVRIGRAGKFADSVVTNTTRAIGVDRAAASGRGGRGCGGRAR